MSIRTSVRWLTEADMGGGKVGIDASKQAHPEVTVHVYSADHGFNCDQRGSYDEAAAKLARARSLAFLAEKLA